MCGSTCFKSINKFESMNRKQLEFKKRLYSNSACRKPEAASLMKRRLTSNGSASLTLSSSKTILKSSP